MKTLKTALLVIPFLFSANVSAEQEGILGTSLLLDSNGILNVYYQLKASEGSAFVGSFATSSGGKYAGSNVDATGYSLSYKSYFSNYASGGYLNVGGASRDITSSSDSTTISSGGRFSFIVAAGYEMPLGSSIIFGAEVGLGAANGWDNLGVHIATSF